MGCVPGRLFTMDIVFLNKASLLREREAIFPSPFFALVREGS